MKPYTIQFILLIFFKAHFTAQDKNESTECKMPSLKIMSVVDIGEKIDGRLVSVKTGELILQPNDKSQSHRHPGPVYSNILKGT